MFGVDILSEYSINVIQNGLNNIVKGIEMQFNGKDFKDFWDFEKESFFAENMYEQLKRWKNKI